MRRAVEFLVSVALGAAVALVGSVGHRSIPPLGVILSILLVLAGTLFVRAWGSWPAVLAFTVPLVAFTFAFTRVGPGGSLLIAADGLGYAWLIGAACAVIAACVVPASLLGAGRRPA